MPAKPGPFNELGRLHVCLNSRKLLKADHVSCQVFMRLDNAWTEFGQHVEDFVRRKINVGGL